MFLESVLHASTWNKHQPSLHELAGVREINGLSNAQLRHRPHAEQPPCFADGFRSTVDYCSPSVAVG